MVSPINFYSTNHKTSPVSFSRALLKGLAPDKGLFMPEEIPELTKEEIQSFSDLSYHKIAYEIGKRFYRRQPNISNQFSRFGGMGRLVYYNV